MDKYPIPAIYSITHVPTGMKYVGYSSNVNLRISQHKSKLRRGRNRGAPGVQELWNRTEESEWTFEVLIQNPGDPEHQEVEEILKIAEEKRLNRVIGHMSGHRVSNEVARASQSKVTVARLKDHAKGPHHGVSLNTYQKPGENYVYRKWRFRVRRMGVSFTKSGFDTAEEAHEARKKYLLETYGEVG